MEVARGEVNIRVNDRGLESELRAAEARFKSSMAKIDAMQAEASVGVDLKRLRRDLAQAEAELKAFEKKRANASTTAERRSAGAFIGNHKKKIALLQEEIRAGETILNNAKAEAKQTQIQVGRQQAITKLTNDRAKATEKASKAVSSEAQQVARLRQQHIKLREEILKADKDIQQRFQSIRSRDRRIIDKERLIADLNEVERALTHLGGKAPEIDVKVDRHGRMADFFKSLSTLTVRVGPFTASLKQLAAAMLALGPIIIGLIGWLSALTGALGAGLVGAAGIAGSALLGLGATGLGVGLIMKPMIEEIGNARKAAEALATAESKYGKGSKEAAKAQEKLNQVLKGVSPEARKAIGDMSKLGAQWDKLAVKPARASVFEALGAGIKAAQKLMPMFARNSVAATKAVSEGFVHMAAVFSGPRFSGALNKLMQNTTKAIKPMMSAFTNLSGVIMNIAASFSRFFEGSALGIEEWSNNLLEATNNTANLDKTVDNLMSKYGSLKNFLGGLTRVLYEFFRAAAGPGAKNLDDMGDSLNKLADRMGSVAGQKKLSEFFSESIETAKKFYSALQPIIKLFIEFATIMRPMVNTALSLIAPLADLLQTLLAFGPVKGIMQGLLVGFLAAGAAKRIWAMVGAFKALALAIKGLTAAGALKKIGDFILGAPVGGRYGPKGPQAPVPVPAPVPGGGKAGRGWGAAFLKGAKVGGVGLLGGIIGYEVSKGINAERVKSNFQKAGFDEAGTQAMISWYDGAKKRIQGERSFGSKIFETLKPGQTSGDAAWQQFDRTMKKLSETTRGRKFVIDLVVNGGQEAQLMLEQLASTKLGSKLLTILSRGGPQAQAYLTKIAQTDIGKKFMDIISRGGPQAQAWLVRLMSTRIGQKFLDIVQRGGPVALMWLNRLAQSEIGQKLLTILSRGGPETQRSLNTLAKTELGRKILNIIDRGGPSALATVRNLSNAKIREKILRVVQHGGPEARRELERILGIKLPTKTQVLRERGGKLVKGIMGDINRTKLQDKSTTLRANNQASGVIQSVIGALARIPLVKTITIAARKVGSALGIGNAKGGVGGARFSSLADDPSVQRSALRNMPAPTGRGGRFTKPTYMVGEEKRPEIVIAQNPAYRKQNLHYFGMAGRMLGIPGFAEGGPKWLANMTNRTSQYAKLKVQIDKRQADYEYDERRFSIANRSKQPLNPDGSINEGFKREREGQLKHLEGIKKDIEELFRKLAEAIQQIIDAIKAAMPRDRRGIHTYQAKERRLAGVEKTYNDKIKRIDALPAPRGTRRQRAAERKRRKDLKEEYRRKRDDAKAGKIRAGKTKDTYSAYYKAEKDALPELEAEKREVLQQKRTVGLDIKELQGTLGEEFDTGIPPTQGQLSLAKGESMIALAGLLTDPQAAYDLMQAGIAEQRRGYEAELARGQAMLRDNTTANDVEAYNLITQSAQGLQQLGSQAATLGGGSAFGTFNAARYDLYRQFGGNSLSSRGYTPSGPHYGTEIGSSGNVVDSSSGISQISGALGGARAGSILKRDGGTGYGFGTGTDQATTVSGGGQKIVNITNNYREQPSDPHTWSKQMAWESNAAL